MIARVLSCPGLITDILGMFVAFVKNPRQNAGSDSLLIAGGKSQIGTQAEGQTRAAGESSAYSEVNVTHSLTSFNWASPRKNFPALIGFRLRLHSCILPVLVSKQIKQGGLLHNLVCTTTSDKHSLALRFPTLSHVTETSEESVRRVLRRSLGLRLRPASASVSLGNRKTAPAGDKRYLNFCGELISFINARGIEIV